VIVVLIIGLAGLLAELGSLIMPEKPSVGEWASFFVTPSMQTDARHTTWPGSKVPTFGQKM
jgi:hypothetical protein